MSWQGPWPCKSPQQWWTRALRPPDLLTPLPHLSSKLPEARVQPMAWSVDTEGRFPAELMSPCGNAAWWQEGRRGGGGPETPESLNEQCALFQPQSVGDGWLLRWLQGLPPLKTRDFRTNWVTVQGNATRTCTKKRKFGRLVNTAYYRSSLPLQKERRKERKKKEKKRKKKKERKERKKEKGFLSWLSGNKLH